LFDTKEKALTETLGLFCFPEADPADRFRDYGFMRTDCAERTQIPDPMEHGPWCTNCHLTSGQGSIDKLMSVEQASNKKSHPNEVAFLFR
jgi:hypothetical protein